METIWSLIFRSAEPIRMMFAIAGVPVEDKRIQMEEWMDVKKGEQLI